MTTTTTSPDYLTLPEAASSLGVATSTLRNQIRAGRLAARKIGRDWWVTVHEVARYRRESLRQRNP